MSLAKSLRPKPSGKDAAAERSDAINSGQIVAEGGMRQGFNLRAQNLIDPGIGLYELEWSDPTTSFRWSGAWPTVKILEVVDRTKAYTLTVMLLGLAKGVSLQDIRCSIDGQACALRAGEEYGLRVLRGEVPAADRSSIEIVLESPLVEDTDGARRRALGFALVSVSLSR